MALRPVTRSTTPFPALAAALLATGLAACSGMAPAPMAPAPFDTASLPDAVKVPPGHRVAWETVGVGEITYECRPKAGMPGQHEWFFVGPKADLLSRDGKTVGRYWGPPATWASLDGSQLTGTQVAVAPAGTGAIPLQLVKANPATGAGDLTGVSYIQRVATKGGVAPSLVCDSGALGQRQVVKYQADYLFWKPA